MFSSSKKKADLPPEPEKRGYFDMSASTTSDYYLFNNVLYIIQELANNHKELIGKIDKLLTQNKELNERCEALENEVGIKKR